jgi:hypothetical protein
VNEKQAERYLKKMLAMIKGPPGTHQKRIDALFVRIKARLSDLESMAEELEAVEENGVYRYITGPITSSICTSRSRRLAIAVKINVACLVIRALFNDPRSVQA